MSDGERAELAETVRRRCVDAAIAAYEAARMDGLCDEGAFEVAIDAVRGLDLATLTQSGRAAD